MISIEKQEIITLSIKDLLSKDHYRIPIYQRNYDWGEKEVLQLVEDIADYASIGQGKKYYIGSLVVFEKQDQQGNLYYETIDGQQRLTTLTILICALKNLKKYNLNESTLAWYVRPNLSYDHRSEADKVLAELILGKKVITEYSSNMTEVYEVMQKNIISIVESKNITLEFFCSYLLNEVVILRVPVPADTQLNHYFEIMNSRGEQLEKHEVLKANLMNEIDTPYHNLFRDIWEACSDMNSYVQMRMKSNFRTLLYKNWEELNYDNFDDIYLEYCHLNDDDENNGTEGYISKSISDLVDDSKSNIHYPLPSDSDSGRNASERFGSIINFPNFLLHVLKIYYHNYKLKKDDVESEIMLDDKRLIDIFLKVIKSIINKDEKTNFVKGFIVELLRIRSLFDKYVIKRENYNNKESWSLKRLKYYSNNKRVNYVATFNDDREDDNDENIDIRMLQAMFHVSAPTQIYKYWLYAVLYYISTNDIINSVDFRTKLINLSKSYMLDRYLNKTECKQQYFKTTFFEVIYNNDYYPFNGISSIEWDNIHQGCSVENYIFNFYDFITWNSNPSKYPTFEFTYRTSVEHFYPQHPINNYPNLRGKGLDDFGNLCLISRNMNAKFSNNMPLAKLANFGNENEVELSIKLQEMMEEVRKTQNWDEKSIADFSEKAKQRLQGFLNQKT